ncbi:hypothetical protein TWF481_002566 [Arthrobotrys musiformis]|uniref:UBC core domain-containing protein n=1 Tax=Arthrobotrys musiformis TaxID=47236 RepID=A0AAV9VTH7_9PEZI
MSTLRSPLRWNGFEEDELQRSDDNISIQRINELFAPTIKTHLAPEEDDDQYEMTDEVVKIHSRHPALRLGPLHLAAPTHPHFLPVFTGLPLPVAVNVLDHWIQQEWYIQRVILHDQHWYQLMRILRAPTVWRTWNAMTAARKRALLVGDVRRRLKSWALCTRNFRSARGISHPLAAQAMLNAETDHFIGRICNLLMDQTAGVASVPCPFCGVNNPNLALHQHWQLRMLVKLFMQGQIQYLSDITLFDLKRTTTDWDLYIFLRWIHDWITAVERVESKESYKIVRNTYTAFAETCRLGTGAINALLNRWETRSGVPGLDGNQSRRRHRTDNNILKQFWDMNWNTAPANKRYQGYVLTGRSIVSRNRDRSIIDGNHDALRDLVYDEVMDVLEMYDGNLGPGHPYLYIDNYLLPNHRPPIAWNPDTAYDCYPFDGTSYLVLPKDAGNVLEHRILHHPTQDGFYEHIINTTNLPVLCTVAPLSLSASKPPVLTLNNEGLVSIFEFGDECADEWANIWNPVTGTQRIMSNDQGQGLAKTLKDVIQARKISGSWPLDGWDVGCLNASTVDTRRPREAVMICVDCSGSMSGLAFESEDQEIRAAERTTKLTAAKMLFKHYSNMVTNYKFPVHFGVMKFDSIVSIMQGFTPLLADVEKGIEELGPGSSTAMWDCIYKGAERLIDFRRDNPGTKARIIVLTDGMDNHSVQTDKTTYSYLWENNIVLDAFSIGRDSNISLFRICGATGGYAMNPASTAEIIQLAEMETMVDQTLRPPFHRQTYLPYFDALQPIKPFTVTAFSVPEACDHPHQNDEFMSLENAHRVFGGNKQVLVDRGGVRAASDVFKSRRMLLEIKDMAENPHPDMDIYISESEMSFWKVVVEGPDGSNYASGTFVMFLDMTDDFPRKAPQARFITPIIHPNINKHGRVCHAVLDQYWKAETKVRDILCCIYGLLMVPEKNDPIDAIATLKYWTQNEKLYSEEISQHIEKFASVNRKDWASRIVPDLDAIPGTAPVKNKLANFHTPAPLTTQDGPTPN